MSSRFLEVFAALMLITGVADAGDLRVCADPDNMPFSNQQLEGFENRMLDLLAEDMGVRLAYVWVNERRASAIEVLNRGRCDVVPGTIAGTPGVATTTAYMRSAYAFVTPAGSEVSGFDDPRLHQLRIGVQSVGDDAVTPPVDALLARGLGANIRPFTLHGNAADPNSAGGIVHAVAARGIDAAVLWGPFAGYYAARQEQDLAVRLVNATPADPPMRFAIAIATREENAPLRDALDRALNVRRGDIERLLARYHVPLLPLDGKGASP